MVAPSNRWSSLIGRGHVARRRTRPRPPAATREFATPLASLESIQTRHRSAPAAVARARSPATTAFRSAGPWRRSRPSPASPARRSPARRLKSNSVTPPRAIARQLGRIARRGTKSAPDATGRGLQSRCVKENSVRHSTGSKFSSPAINCSRDVATAIASRSLDSAACTSVAMAAGPGRAPAGPTASDRPPPRGRQATAVRAARASARAAPSAPLAVAARSMANGLLPNRARTSGGTTRNCV